MTEQTQLLNRVLPGATWDDRGGGLWRSRDANHCGLCDYFAYVLVAGNAYAAASVSVELVAEGHPTEIVIRELLAEEIERRRSVGSTPVA